MPGPRIFLLGSLSFGEMSSGYEQKDLSLSLWGLTVCIGEEGVGLVTVVSGR